MGKKYLASVAEVELLYKNNGVLQHFASAHTLTDSALSFTNSMEEVRGGQGGKLLGRFSHTSGVTLQMTDVLFDTKYLQALIGAELAANNEGVRSVLTVEAISFSAGVADDAVTSTPANMGSLCGSEVVLGWISKQGDCSGNATIYPVTLDSYGKPVVADADKTAVGDGVYCVYYFKTVSEATLMKINAAFQPMELFAILTINEFAADATASTSDGIVGKLIFKFPRYQFDGSFDLSLAMSSQANISLNGTVLAVSDASGVCGADKLYYGEILEVATATDGTVVDWRDALKDIIVDPEYLATTAIPNVWGIYTNKQPIMLANSQIAAQTATGHTGNFNGFVKKTSTTYGSTAIGTDGKWGTAGEWYVCVIKKTLTNAEETVLAGYVAGSATAAPSTTLANTPFVTVEKVTVA